MNSWIDHSGLSREFFSQQAPIYHKFRLELACLVRDWFSELNFDNWFLDGGTLLGAYRSGEMISHDYDFDMAILGTEETLDRLFEGLKKIIVTTNGEIGYERFRVIRERDYCQKLVVIDTLYGRIDCPIEWWYVYIDIQLYLDRGKEGVRIAYHKDGIDQRRLSRNWIAPFGTIELEGEKWSCPACVKSVLETIYGNIEPGAKFDPETGLYV